MHPPFTTYPAPGEPSRSPHCPFPSQPFPEKCLQKRHPSLRQKFGDQKLPSLAKSKLSISRPNPHLTSWIPQNNGNHYGYSCWHPIWNPTIYNLYLKENQINTNWPTWLLGAKKAKDRRHMKNGRGRGWRLALSHFGLQFLGFCLVDEWMGCWFDQLMKGVFPDVFFSGKLEASIQRTSPKISPYMAVYEKIMKICWKESIQN